MIVFDDAPRRDAIELVSFAHDASGRVAFAAARFLRDVARAAGSTVSRRRLSRPAISQPQIPRFPNPRFESTLTWNTSFSGFCGYTHCGKDVELTDRRFAIIVPLRMPKSLARRRPHVHNEFDYCERHVPCEHAALRWV